MSSTESRIRILFDGSAAGVVAASAAARKAIAGVNDETSKLAKAADRTGSGLLAVGKGMSALGSAGGAVSTVGAVAGAVAQLAPAALLLPGALLAGAAAMGTFKVATTGFGEAIGAGLSGDVEKLAEATKGMAPAMREAVAATVAFKPQLDALKKTVQGEFWDGFSKQITNLGNRYLPVVDLGMAGVSRSLGVMARQAAQAVDNDLFSGQVSRIFDNTADSINNMAPALGKVLTSFVRLGAVGSDYLPRLGTAIDAVATKFSNWVTGTSDAQLKAMIDGAIRGFQDLGGIVSNIGSIIGSVFRGLGTDISSPLAGLRDLTGEMAAFLKTVEAQDGLRALGDTLRVMGEQVGRVVLTALRELAPTLVAAAPAAQALARGIGDFLVGAIETVGPLLRGLAGFLSENAGAIEALTPVILSAAVAVKGLQVFNQVRGWVSGATSALQLFADNVDLAGKKAAGADVSIGGFGKKLGGLRTVLGAAGVTGAILGVGLAIDEMNIKAAGGVDKLNGIAVNLHQFRDVLQKAFSGDLGLKRVLDQAQAVSQGIQNQFNGIKLTPLKLNADGTPARADVNQLIGEINRMTPMVNINGNTNGAAFAYRQILAEIAEGKAEIIIDGQPVPAQEALARVKSLIDSASGNVTINGDGTTASGALDQVLGQINSSVGTIQIDGNRDPATGKVTQAVQFADGSKGTITLDGNNIPAKGETTRAVQFADGSTGTIRLDGNRRDADGKIIGVVTYANGQTGTVKINADASRAQGVIDGFITRNDGRQIRIYTSVLGAGGIASAGRLATGGPVYGPGTGTSDTAGLFRLSRGEHVLTAREVQAAGGHGAIMAFRRGLIGRQVPRLAARGRAATGGAITPSGALTVPAPVVNVANYIDGQEIRGLIDTRIEQSSRATRRTVLAGGGTSF